VAETGDMRTNSGGSKSAPPPVRRHWWKRRWLHVLAVVAVVVGATLAFAAVYVDHHAEPILRANLVRTLSERFNADVELDHLDVSVMQGLQVHGEGLRIFRTADAMNVPVMPGAPPSASPALLLRVESFTFRTSLHDLLKERVHISSVHVNGMEIHVPPHTVGQPQRRERRLHKPRLSFVVDQIFCDNTKLLIETTKPGKDPLDFDIPRLQLTNVGGGQPLLYVADVVNPKPVGNIHAFGHFGPWQPDDPRSTPLDGDYRFDHADLNTIKGIGGNLSSTGHYEGQLDHITIDGTTETPNFSLDVSHHPMHLSTRFHAYVDGTSGDTTLDPVQATLGRSEFTASGSVLRVRGKGHDIDLTVSMPHGHIEDMLQLGMKTEPPVMRGVVSMHARLHIPPSQNQANPVPVPQRMQLAGNLSIHGVEFSNGKLQDRIDGLSMRAQGKPEDVRTAGSDRRAEVASQMRVGFALSNAMMMVDSLYYEVPGATVNLHGVYSLDGNIFEFKGRLRTEARPSQMVTGWKSLLLKAVDPFLAKNGAGLELPISISGTKGDVKLGLAMHDADESPKAMAEDVKAQRKMQRDVKRAERP
jgi:hypothetical protein